MQLSAKQKAAFGVGAVGKDMVYALSSSYVMYYYQDLIGLPAAFVGTILMVARVFDAFNDPFMGVIVAKTNTKMGRYRPWLVSGTVLNALVLYLLFAAPDFAGAFQRLSGIEGIIPAVESSHALAYLEKLMPETSPEETVVVTLSGRGDKDVQMVAKVLGEEA